MLLPKKIKKTAGFDFSIIDLPAWTNRWPGLGPKPVQRGGCFKKIKTRPLTNAVLGPGGGHRAGGIFVPFTNVPLVLSRSMRYGRSRRCTEARPLASCVLGGPRRPLVWGADLARARRRLWLGAKKNSAAVAAHGKKITKKLQLQKNCRNDCGT